MEKEGQKARTKLIHELEEGLESDLIELFLVSSQTNLHSTEIRGINATITTHTVRSATVAHGKLCLTFCKRTCRSLWVALPMLNPLSCPPVVPGWRRSAKILGTTTTIIRLSWFSTVRALGCFQLAGCRSYSTTWAMCWLIFPTTACASSSTPTVLDTKMGGGLF